MPTKDSADKWSNRMDEESTSKVAAFSFAVAWRHGHRPGPPLFRHIHPNRILHPSPIAPVLDSFGAELVRLVAGLILSTRQESSLHA